MQINIKLDTRSVKAAIRNAKKYQNRLRIACEKYVEELADLGISVAKMNEGEYAGKILYSKRTDKQVNGCTCIMVAEGTDVPRSWNTKNGMRTANVNALLMAEFGSGWRADDNNARAWGANAGQGTFPEQTHAFDQGGWWWVDDTGKHHSYGESPTYPMYNAYMEMFSQMNTVAQKVFGEVLKHGQ